MRFLGAADNIVDTSVAYARVVFLGMPFFFVFMVLTSMLRGVSDTTTPLFSLGFSIIAGLVITPALIQGWFGLPQIGVLSAAVAFITGTATTLVFLYFYLDWRQSPMAPSHIIPGYLKVDVKLLGTILRLGIPTGISMIVSSLSALVVVGIVNRFGSNATAAFGAVNQVLSYVQFPAMSLTIASSIFAAQAIGARRMDEVEHVTRTGLIMNVFITGGLILIAYLFSENLVRLFITSEEVVHMTETLLHIVLWSVIAFGFGGVFSAVMRASGDVWIPMALSLVGIILVEVPAALILSRMIGLEGIWIATAELLHHAGAAGGVLHAGLAQEGDSGAGLGATKRRTAVSASGSGSFCGLEAGRCPKAKLHRRGRPGRDPPQAPGSGVGSGERSAHTHVAPVAYPYPALRDSAAPGSPRQPLVMIAQSARGWRENMGAAQGEDKFFRGARR